MPRWGRVSGASGWMEPSINGSESYPYRGKFDNE
jgi:hypothetical protein